MMQVHMLLLQRAEKNIYNLTFIVFFEQYFNIQDIIVNKNARFQHLNKFVNCIL